MTDHLSDVFRANVRAALRANRMTQDALCRRMKAHPTTFQTQINNPRGTGLTLATVERYATALGIEPAVLLTPGGVQRRRTVKVERVA